MKKRNAFSFITAFLLATTLVSSLTVHAADWMHVGTAVSGDEFYVREDSVRREGAHVGALILEIDHVTRKQWGQSWIFDCWTGDAILVKENAYNEQGGLMDSINYLPTMQWQSVPSGTVLSAARSILCKGQRQRPAVRRSGKYRDK